MTKLGSVFGGWSCPGCGTWYPPSKRVDVQTPSMTVTLCQWCSPGD